MDSVYGIAGRLLPPALASEKKLFSYLEKELELFYFAKKFLKVNC